MVALGKLSYRQKHYLEVLAQGGTFEDRNLPSIPWNEREQLRDWFLIEFKGSNGMCAYWALTGDGEELVDSFRTAESPAEAPAAAPAPAPEDWCVHPTQRELEAYGDGFTAGYKDAQAETERLRAALAAAESVIARIGELHPYSTTYHAFDQYHTEIGDIVSDYADKQARQDAG